jgi:hypothetical protein
MATPFSDVDPSVELPVMAFPVTVTASCIAVSLSPPIERLALRAVPLFAAAVSVTNPSPVPLAGLTEIQPAGDVADHEQDGLLAVTNTFVLPPAWL